MKSSVVWSAGGALFLLGAAAIAPVRHRVRLENSQSNAVQHLVLESRSLLGFRRPAWGARATSKSGTEIWGSGWEGFFLAPQRAVDVEVRAWPGFRQTLSIAPLKSDAELSLLGEGDREAFRAWFVAILEQQLDKPSPAWEPAQRDCAGLIRFAFHEAWGPHTEAWRDRVGYAGSPVASDPNPDLAGPWRNAFPTSEGWKPFAKGALLRSGSCVLLGRELTEARPGDLLFFTRVGVHAQPDHVMAFVRPDGDGQPVLLYNTGPEQSGASAKEGETRRVRLDELLHHPDADFRPLPENPAFLGVYRWKVLCSASLLRDLSLQAQR